MSKQEFVTDLYEIFHTRLASRTVKDFEEIQGIYQTIIQELLSTDKSDKNKRFDIVPRKQELYTIYEDLIKQKKLSTSFLFETILTSKLVRSSSGVLPISIALDGAQGSCSENCHMCPNECKENGAERDMARSYLSSEGTFIRGEIQDFQVVEQTWRRLAELEAMGHIPDKLEFILLGGTFDCYPREYRFQTSLDIFYACNTYRHISIRMDGIHSNLLQEWLVTNPFAKASPLSGIMLNLLHSMYPRPLIWGKTQKQIDHMLRHQQTINTKLEGCRVIGIVLETRQDRVNRYSLTEMRKLGCTRIQIGVQSDCDEVLKYINRGHTVATTIRANTFIRDNGFKIDGHIMPDLPGTTLEKDYHMVRHVFQGDDLQLDYCKIYPCLDLPFTEIRKWKHSGKWKPIAENQFPEFLDFLAYTMSIVPPWTRVNRVQRDFPEATVKNHHLGYVSETIRSNLQQIVTQHMAKKGMKSYDIRAREVRNAIIDTQLQYAKLYVRVYRANGGTEFFISVEIPLSPDDFNDTNLMGLCRLRIPDTEFNKELIPFHYLPVYRNKERIARIRELHVYGNVASLNKDGNSQHRGVGKFLMNVAELIASTYDCTMMTVISGVGVRDYYEHIGYTLDDHEDQYMIKKLSKEQKLEKELVLFQKMYLPEEVEKAVEESIISKKYIKKIGQSGEKTDFERYVYTTVQNGEAEGFSFYGKEIPVKESWSSEVKEKKEKKEVKYKGVLIVNLLIFILFLFVAAKWFGF